MSPASHTVAGVSPRRARRLPGDVHRKGRPGAGPAPGAARGEGAAESGLPARGADMPAGPEHTESWPDGEWVIRLVPGASAGKAYRCPGCDQEIQPGTPHLVAWPALTPGLDTRRHWHRTCWRQRLHRRPGPRRPR